MPNACLAWLLTLCESQKLDTYKAPFHSERGFVDKPRQQASPGPEEPFCFAGSGLWACFMKKGGCFIESVWAEFMVSESHLIHCQLSNPKFSTWWVFGQMILGLERLKEEVSALQSLDTHPNLSEFTSSHLPIQVCILQEAGKRRRHVKRRSRVPVDLTILSI